MITVDAPTTSHHFPALDFKFQNTGHASAVLWKFCLIIEEVKIDPQPVLSGQVRLKGEGDTPFRRTSENTLCATVRNDGWGTAFDCELTLRSPILDILFPLHARQVRAVIPVGATYDLLLPHACIDQEKLLDLRNRLRDEARIIFNHELGDMIERHVQDKRRSLRSVPIQSDADARDHFLSTPENRRRYLEDPDIRKKYRARTLEGTLDEASERTLAEAQFRAEFDQRWGSQGGGFSAQKILIQYNLRDEWDRSFSGSISPDMGGSFGGDIEVTADSFTHHQHFVAACMSIPDTIYSCIIDADRGAHSKEYPISRVISSGEAEHFQIVVGATKSSHIKVKFRFYADKATVVESKPFFLELWNPSNARWDHSYRDGDVIRSVLKAAEGKSREKLSWEEREALSDKAKLDAFPFVLPHRSRASMF